MTIHAPPHSLRLASACGTAAGLLDDGRRGRSGERIRDGAGIAVVHVEVIAAAVFAVTTRGERTHQRSTETVGGGGWNLSEPRGPASGRVLGAAHVSHSRDEPAATVTCEETRSGRCHDAIHDHVLTDADGATAVDDVNLLRLPVEGHAGKLGGAAEADFPPSEEFGGRIGRIPHSRMPATFIGESRRGHHGEGGCESHRRSDESFHCVVLVAVVPTQGRRP